MYHVGKTLFIVSEKVYISCDNATILVKNEHGQKYRFAYEILQQIVLFYEDTVLSVYVMNRCAEHAITIHYVSKYGRYLGSFLGYKNGNVMLRKAQFDMSNTEKSVAFVQNLLAAKIRNSIWLLRYFGHHSVYRDQLHSTVDKLKQCRDSLRQAKTMGELRLLEMNAAHMYFQEFDNLITVGDISMKFEKRSRRPPLNNVNALLSFFYTMLLVLCESAIVVRGMDVECGYLHTLRSGRASLACDLMEEFRACIVDRFVITLVNRKEVKSTDFYNDNGQIRICDDVRKKLLVKWDDFLNKTVVHHKLYDKDVSYKILVYEQAQYLAQYIRGDISEYPPFYQ